MEQNSDLVFHIFTAPNCPRCKKEIPTVVKALKEAGYRVIMRDISDMDGCSEAAFRGLTTIPYVIGEIREPNF